MKIPVIFADPNSISSCCTAARLLAELHRKGDAEHYLAFHSDVSSDAALQSLSQAAKTYSDLGVHRVYFAGYNANAVQHVAQQLPIAAEGIDILHCKEYSLFTTAWCIQLWENGGEALIPKVFEWADTDDFIYWLSHAISEMNNPSYRPEEDMEALSLIEAAKEEYKAQPPIRAGYRCCSCNARFKFPATFTDSHG